MGSRAELSGIRIVNITRHGKDTGFSSFGDKLAKLPPSGFVAIDAEFSGLGSDPDLSSDDLGVRYAAIRRLADTRAIFSVGLSIFSPVTEDAEGAEQDKSVYEVATYDWLMSCKDDFTTNENAGQFLVTHSFDFNRMFMRGIPYARASTEKTPAVKGAENEKSTAPWRWDKLPRGLLWRIGRQGVPLVLHNGLFDLAFMFAAFQGPLPPTLHGFIGALLDCVPAGYWDNKMLASAVLQRRSFLGYLFASAVLKEKISVRNSSGLPADALTNPPEEQPATFAKDLLCELYSYRGFCPRGTSCPFMHDPFVVVQQEQKGTLPKDSREAHKRHKVQSKKLKKHRVGVKLDLSKLSKKQRKKILAEQQGCESAVLECNLIPDSETGGEPTEKLHGTEDRLPAIDNERKVHTAGWDAFCTGYVFAAYRASMPQEKLNESRNKIAVSSKSNGLFLCKSSFGDLDTLPEKENAVSPSSSLSDGEATN